MKRFLTTHSELIVAVAFAGLGLFIGYLAGVSSSPVVSALLPGVFGIVAGVGVLRTQGHWSISSVRKSLEERNDIPPDMKERLLGVIAADKSSEWLPGYYGIVVLLFCVFAFGGSVVGYLVRSSQAANEAYPTAAKLVESFGIDKCNRLQRITVATSLLRCKQLRISPADCQFLMQELAEEFKMNKDLPETKTTWLKTAFKEYVSDGLDSDTLLPIDKPPGVLLGP